MYILLYLLLLYSFIDDIYPHGTPKPLQLICKQALSDNPKLRPTIKKFLECNYFKNTIIEYIYNYINV